MNHRSLIFSLSLSLAAALMSYTSSGARAAETVTVGADSTLTYTVKVNDSITIPIYGTVTSSSGSPSGIFTYDFDALVNDPRVQITGYVLDGDTALGNASFINLNASGAHNLNAGFDTSNVGAGTRAELFKITVKGLATGTSTISIGDSIVPQGSPIVLYDNSEPPVNTSPITVIVSAVPEPTSIAFLGAGLLLLMRRRRSKFRGASKPRN